MALTWEKIPHFTHPSTRPIHRSQPLARADDSRFQYESEPLPHLVHGGRAATKRSAWPTSRRHCKRPTTARLGLRPHLVHTRDPAGVQRVARDEPEPWARVGVAAGAWSGGASASSVRSGARRSSSVKLTRGLGGLLPWQARSGHRLRHRGHAASSTRVKLPATALLGLSAFSWLRVFEQRCRLPLLG